VAINNIIKYIFFFVIEVIFEEIAKENNILKNDIILINCYINI
jgi:hypothetical protein